MKEFLVATEFLADVGAFSSAGNALNSTSVSIDSGGVSTLATSMAYIEQQKAIKALIDSYVALIQKDVKDLFELQRTAALMDARIAGSLLN